MTLLTPVGGWSIFFFCISAEMTRTGMKFSFSWRLSDLDVIIAVADLDRGQA